ncbi:MAG: hypothetical protein ACJA0U_003122 [Salibacteraceae bacterium]|jgi:hypothetical protein
MKKVTYNKGVAIGMGLFAILMLYFGFTLDILAVKIAGSIIIFLSILYIVNSAVKYDDKTMELKSPLGLTVGKFDFKKDKFKVDGDMLTINGKKFKISPLMLTTAEYQALLDHIQSVK